MQLRAAYRVRAAARVPVVARVGGRRAQQSGGPQLMAKDAAIEIEGKVEQVLPNTTFRVLLSNGHYVLATIAGKMRRFRIRVLAGDRVTLALSPYDLTRGRITFRHK